MTYEYVESLRQRVQALESEANELLSKYGVVKSRIITVDQMRRQLQALSLQQDELFAQSIACVENGIFRAAHVMAWAAFMDCLEEKLASDGLVKIRQARSGWNKYATMEELREAVPESQLLEAARDVGFFSKSEAKSLAGLLSKRNECAHPSTYRPDVNESLGYVSELLNRIQKLVTKSL